MPEEEVVVVEMDDSNLAMDNVFNIFDSTRIADNKLSSKYSSFIWLESFEETKPSDWKKMQTKKRKQVERKKSLEDIGCNLT